MFRKMIHYGDRIFDVNTSGVLGSGMGSAFGQEHPLTRKRPEDDGQIESCGGKGKDDWRGADSETAGGFLQV